MAGIAIAIAAPIVLQAAVQGGLWLFRKLRPPEKPAEVPDDVLRKDERYRNMMAKLQKQLELIRKLRDRQRVTEEQAAKDNTLAAENAALRKRMAEEEAKKREQEEQMKKRRKELIASIYENAKKAGLDPQAFNLVFCGQAGTGKSSLINSILEEHVAATNVIDCTKKPRKFRHNKNPCLIYLWDVPGAATMDRPVESYYADNFLYLMDVVVVVVGNRLLADDVGFIQTAKRHGQSVVVVRSKADNDVESLIREEKNSVMLRYDRLQPQEQEHYRKKVWQVVNGETKALLAEQDLSDVPFYYISSTAIEEFNEARKAGKVDEQQSPTFEPTMYPGMDESAFMAGLFTHLKKRMIPLSEDDFDLDKIIEKLTTSETPKAS